MLIVLLERFDEGCDCLSSIKIYFICFVFLSLQHFLLGFIHRSCRQAITTFISIFEFFSLTNKYNYDRNFFIDFF